ncbi:zinc finger protein 37 isoform X2 [Anopheles stephensi]|uniref:zinc finger protein 37 isoform X2 n=1 Tax=Anopheles stephensi TaxID=30069 RepID=UPI0016589653|nr:zinc finger protein 37 isoform X2 [Anopheles stephensi]
MDADVLSAPQASEERQKGKWKYYADNFNHLCRLCLSQERLVAIYYNVQGRNAYYIRNFVKLALDLLKIKINKHDALPNFLCEKCERNLNIITNFKRKCDESMKLLNGIRESRSRRDQLDTPAKAKRRRKAPTKRVKQDCADILKKLPQEIHVEKKAVSQNREVGHDSTDIAASRELTEELQNDRLLGSTKEDELLKETQPPEQLSNNLQAAHSDEEIEFITMDDYFEVQEETEYVIDTTHIIQRKGDPSGDGATAKETKKPLPKEKIVCSVCGTKVNNIKSHMVIHSARAHKCDQCPKSFTSRNKLQSHINGVHLRKRDFKCDICNKAFLEKNNLKGHLRIHSGERKYACNLCPKTFLFAGTLRCHMLTHTQEKRHECEVCGKLFLLRTTLNKHLRVHSDEKPHSCSVCAKRFRTTTHMVVHMRTHTGEKPLSCRICGMSFAHHKGRSVHMKTKHAQELVEQGLIDDKGHLKC